MIAGLQVGCRRRFIIKEPHLPKALAPFDAMQIPTESGHRFRLDAGHDSDLKAATIPI
jgi:hypothetical protein